MMHGSSQHQGDTSKAVGASKINNAPYREWETSPHSVLAHGFSQRQGQTSSQSVMRHGSSQCQGDMSEGVGGSKTTTPQS
jgi:hypothetical protein